MSFLFLLSCLGASHVLAAPADPSAYVEARGGMVNLKSGSLIEGSTSHGGLQPDYILDTWVQEWKPLLGFAQEVGRSTQPYWSKIDSILDYLETRVLPASDYENPAYLGILEEYRLKGEQVPLSRYAAVRAGVCRENALFTHMALKAAGIANRHVYTWVESADAPEDHAFTVVEHDGEEWIVDSYNDHFNGYRLKDLMKEGGPRPGDPVAPVRRTYRYRRVVRINDYPRYWIPKEDRR